MKRGIERGTKRKEKIEERNKRDRRETCSLYRELSFERTINTRYTRVPSLFFLRSRNQSVV